MTLSLSLSLSLSHAHNARPSPLPFSPHAIVKLLQQLVKKSDQTEDAMIAAVSKGGNPRAVQVQTAAPSLVHITLPCPAPT